MCFFLYIKVSHLLRMKILKGKCLLLVFYNDFWMIEIFFIYTENKITFVLLCYNNSPSCGLG